MIIERSLFDRNRQGKAAFLSIYPNRIGKDTLLTIIFCKKHGRDLTKDTYCAIILLLYHDEATGKVIWCETPQEAALTGRYTTLVDRRKET